MRGLLLFIVCFSFATTASADEPVNKVEVCSRIGELAAKVMELRQQEVPMSNLMKIEVDQSIKAVAQAMIIAAYDEPSFSTEQVRKRTVDEFRNARELDCYKAFK